MKKPFKRISALLLAVLMVCMLWPTAAFAAYVDLSETGSSEVFTTIHAEDSRVAPLADTGNTWYNEQSATIYVGQQLSAFVLPQMNGQWASYFVTQTLTKSSSDTAGMTGNVTGTYYQYNGQNLYGYRVNMQGSQAGSCDVWFDYAVRFTSGGTIYYGRQVYHITVIEGEASYEDSTTLKVGETDPVTIEAYSENVAGTNVQVQSCTSANTGIATVTGATVSGNEIDFSIYGVSKGETDVTVKYTFRGYVCDNLYGEAQYTTWTVTEVIHVTVEDPNPTPEPTETPVPDPTETPTPEPTEEPTPEPTQEPTPVPTDEPTPTPTDEPTPAPTDEPEPTETPDLPDTPTPLPQVGPDLDPGFSYKVGYPGILKEVDTSSLTPGFLGGQKVTYTLYSTIPENLKQFLKAPGTAEDPRIENGNAEPESVALAAMDWAEADGTYNLVFKDQLPDVLTFDGKDSVKVTLYKMTEDDLTPVEIPNTYYTVNETEEDATFSVTIDLVKLYNAGEYIDFTDLGLTTIAVSYTATFITEEDGSDVTINPGAYTNKAWVEYPVLQEDEETGESKTVTEKSVEAGADVNAYGIRVFKYDSNGKAGLEGAEFALYTDETCETEIATATSDENGYLSFNGVAPGTYYLKETKAPEGYVKSEASLTVEITEDKTDVYVVEAAFANAPVPKTGGNGTMMFTISGIAMTLLALGYWAMTRKREDLA